VGLRRGVSGEKFGKPVAKLRLTSTTAGGKVCYKASRGSLPRGEFNALLVKSKAKKERRNLSLGVEVVDAWEKGVS